MYLLLHGVCMLVQLVGAAVSIGRRVCMVVCFS